MTKLIQTINERITRNNEAIKDINQVINKTQAYINNVRGKKKVRRTNTTKP